MASASITVRTTKSGRRFHVRYRLGGRAYPVEHGGSFATMREARVRRDLIGGELAAGRSPRVLLDALTAPSTPSRTFLAVAEEYQRTRVDLAAHTTTKAKSHLKVSQSQCGAIAAAASKRLAPGRAGSAGSGGEERVVSGVDPDGVVPAR